jgi:hypothetical protein
MRGFQTYSKASDISLASLSSESRRTLVPRHGKGAKSEKPPGLKLVCIGEVPRAKWEGAADQIIKNPSGQNPSILWWARSSRGRLPLRRFRLLDERLRLVRFDPSDLKTPASRASCDSINPRQTSQKRGYSRGASVWPQKMAC